MPSIQTDPLSSLPAHTAQPKSAPAISSAAVAPPALEVDQVQLSHPSPQPLLDVWSEKPPVFENNAFGSSLELMDLQHSEVTTTGKVSSSLESWSSEGLEMRWNVLTGELRDTGVSTELHPDPEIQAFWVNLEPPAKDATPTAHNVQQLQLWLSAHHSGGALADSTFEYYEQLDNYLGPWGEEGYPIQYGKRYNASFMLNERLMANPDTREWIQRVGLLLQESITGFVVERFSAGELGSLTESELREFAFDSHPLAYTDAGLADVVLTAPELLPFISAVPSAEFVPFSGNALASWKQVGQTSMTVGADLANLTYCNTVGKKLDELTHSSVCKSVGPKFSLSLTSEQY